MTTNNVDLGGDTLYVTDVVVGSTSVGQLSGTSVSTFTTAPKTQSITTATYAPTAAQTGYIFTLNRASGSTVTLPASVVGTTYTFIIGTALSSSAYKIITNAGTIFLCGGVFFDKSLTMTRYDADGSTILSLNLNGTTTGGASVGDQVTITCVSATEWTVSGVVTASGTLATPFATS
jgi:hypothetical protein